MCRLWYPSSGWPRRCLQHRDGRHPGLPRSPAYTRSDMLRASGYIQVRDVVNSIHTVVSVRHALPFESFPVPPPTSPSIPQYGIQ